MKTAIVTGSSSGIGLAVTKRLLEKGYKVYGISRSNSPIEHNQFVQLHIDLTETDSLKSLPAKITENNIDVLINNAGTAFEKDALSFTESDFLTIYDLNFKAPILLTSLLKEKLNGGLVITTSSISDRIPGPGHGLYCSSKAALNIFFDCVAIENLEIKVISILPDYVDTPLLRKLQEGVDFDWSETISIDQISKVYLQLIEKQDEIHSGTRVIVINNALIEDLEYKEKLLVFNVDTNQLS